MIEPVSVYIGYDPKESAAFHVLAHSIARHASRPVSITPVNLLNLREFNRERDPKQSTEFAFSRFLIPYLTGFKGRAIFMDCDMLCRGDITELFDSDPLSGAAVRVVKHDYVPKSTTKFLGQAQTVYPRKNWSSVMLFNCFNCRNKVLTPDYVSRATGLELHQFQWLEDYRIGEIPKEWNWLVSEYPYNPDAKLVHFTLGGPYFNEYRDCDYADEWFRERDMAMNVEQRAA